MKIILNETERKPLAALLGEYTNTKPQYLRAPSYAYQIGDLLLTREGNIEGPDTVSQAEYDELLGRKRLLPERNRFSSGSGTRS